MDGEQIRRTRQQQSGRTGADAADAGDCRDVYKRQVLRVENMAAGGLELCAGKSSQRFGQLSAFEAGGFPWEAVDLEFYRLFCAGGGMYAYRLFRRKLAHISRCEQCGGKADFRLQPVRDELFCAEENYISQQRRLTVRLYGF